jgi:hypothetical protein
MSSRKNRNRERDVQPGLVELPGGKGEPPSLTSQSGPPLAPLSGEARQYDSSDEVLKSWSEGGADPTLTEEQSREKAWQALKDVIANGGLSRGPIQVLPEHTLILPDRWQYLQNWLRQDSFQADADLLGAEGWELVSALGKDRHLRNEKQEAVWVPGWTCFWKKRMTT